MAYPLGAFRKNLSQLESDIKNILYFCIVAQKDKICCLQCYDKTIITRYERKKTR